MTRLRDQVFACALDALAKSANDTTMVPQAEEVHVRRLARRSIKVSVKLPGQRWKRFVFTMQEIDSEARPLFYGARDQEGVE